MGKGQKQNNVKAESCVAFFILGAICVSNYDVLVLCNFKVGSGWYVKVYLFVNVKVWGGKVY